MGHLVKSITSSNTRYDMGNMLGYDWQCQAIKIPSDMYHKGVTLRDQDLESGPSPLSADILMPDGLHNHTKVNKTGRSTRNTAPQLDLTRVPVGTQVFTGTSYHNIHSISLDHSDTDKLRAAQSTPLSDSPSQPSPNNDYVTHSELRDSLSYV